MVMEKTLDVGYEKKYKSNGNSMEGVFSEPKKEDMDEKLGGVGGGGCEGRGIKCYRVRVQIGGGGIYIWHK